MEWFDAVPMTKVVDRLYLGNFYNASHLVESNLKGITAVMDVSDKTGTKHFDDVREWLANKDKMNDECGYLLPEGIKYKHNAFSDGYGIPENLFWDSLLFLKEQYEAGETILIHCIAGISRSPTITASFMHFHLGWEFDAALLFLSKVRPIINPAPAIKVSAKKFLKVYPYDGSMDESKVVEEFVWMDAERAALFHPNPDCALRKFFLLAAKLGDKDNTARHTIPCTCSPRQKVD